MYWFCFDLYSYACVCACEGRIAARVYYDARHDETRQDASKQVQRIFRGYQVALSFPLTRLLCPLSRTSPVSLTLTGLECNMYVAIYIFCLSKLYANTSIRKLTRRDIHNTGQETCGRYGQGSQESGRTILSVQGCLRKHSFSQAQFPCH